MKKFLLFILSYSLTNVFSQPLSNKVIHNENNNTANLIFHQGNVYYLILKHSSLNYYDSLFVHSYSASGSLRFKTVLVRGEDTELGKLFVTNDEKIGLVNSEGACDVVVPGGYFTKIDTNGSILINKRYTNNMRDVCQLAGNGAYYVSTGERVLKLDSLGNLLDSTQIMGNIAAISTYSVNDLLVNASANPTSTPQHHILNASLATQQTLNANSACTKYVLYNGYYYALTTYGNIEKLSNQLQLVASTSSLTGYSGKNVSDFIISNDTIYAVGTSGNWSASNGFFLRLRTDLTSAILAAGNNTNRHYPCGIALQGNTVHILANNWGYSTKSITSAYISYTKMLKTDPYSFKHDVLLKRAVIDSSYVGGAPFFKLYYRYKVRGVNNGTTVINSFFINQMYSGLRLGCNRSLFQQKITGLNLSPGDSVEFVTNFIASYHPDQPNIYSQLDECLYLTAPNDMNDVFTENDSYCSLFKGLSIREESAVQKFLFYPNPVNDLLSLQFDQALNKTKVTFKITDIFGKQVLAPELQEVNAETKINVSQLKTGVYFLEMYNSGDLVAVGKIVKE